MATTTFTNGVTLTDDDWFNDVDFLTYDIFGDSTTTASAASRLTPSIRSLDHATGVLVTGTLSVSAQATVAGLTLGGTLSVSAKATFNAVAVNGVLSVTAIAGAVVATQAQMESALSSDVFVTPLRVHFHPGVAKAWVRFNGAAASVTAAAAYNISSITDKGTGNYNIIFATPFANSNYIASVLSTNVPNHRWTSISTASTEILLSDFDATAGDSDNIAVVFFGDH